MWSVIVVWMVVVALVYCRCERRGRPRWRIEVDCDLAESGGARPYRVGWLPRWLSRAPGRVRLAAATTLAMGMLLLPGVVACVLVPAATGQCTAAAGSWARGLVGGLSCLVWMHAAIATPVLALLVGDELLTRHRDAAQSAELFWFGSLLAAVALVVVAAAVLSLSADPSRWVLVGGHLGLAALWIVVGRLVHTVGRDRVLWEAMG